VTPLPSIVAVKRDGDALNVELDLERDLIHCEGHFPGTPILPAVAQVDWAVRLAREHYTLPAHFSALRGLKFLRIVQPPVQITLELALEPNGRAVAFTYRQSGTACSQGRIEFADDATGPDRSLLQS
jgi:3-hydroxymyristoyl/3-hydroxydecanoyl-(acyl carrier protein) dehydratase